MKKIVALMILSILITSVPVLASESPTSIEISKELPGGGGKWVEITDLSGFIRINSLGRATVCADVSTTTPDVKKVILRAKLMQYKNGGWTEKESWTETNYDNFHGFTKYHSVPKGYQYKVDVTAWVYDGGGALLDTASDSTTTVIY